MKDYVRNKAYREGSIAERYIAKECLTFCSRYLQCADTMFNRPQQHSNFIDNAELYKFSTIGRVKGESMILDHKSITQAHHYVLLHSKIISDYRRLAHLRNFKFKYLILFFKLH